MRVLHVINDVAAGGAQTLVEALALHRENGQERHLAVLLSRDVLSDRMATAFDSVTYFDAPKTPRSLITCVHELRKLTAELAPDIVHSHLTQADLVSLIAKRPGIPLVSTFHNSKDPSGGRASRLAARLVRVLSARFDAVVACDDSAVGHLRESMPNLDLRVIENGTPIPPEIFTASHEHFFLSLAGYRPQKAHAVMLEAFGRFQIEHPDWELVLAGAGLTPENQDLARLVSRHTRDPRAVRLLGPVENPRDLLDTAAALVISSDFEGLPMAVLESAARGTPVVSTDVGGCHKAIPDKRFLVEPGNAAALAASMATLATLSTDEYSKLSSDTRSIAQKTFDISVKAREYSELYQEKLEGRPAAGEPDAGIPVDQSLLQTVRRDIGLTGSGMSIIVAILRVFTVRTLSVLLFRLSSVAGKRLGPLGLLVKQLNHVLTGADIAWQAEIGGGLRLYHPTGVVIGPHVTIGTDCRIQQGVTIGGMGGDQASREDSPTVGNCVEIGTGAKILGRIHVGNAAKIGANAVVLKTVPDRGVAVGVPARVIDYA